MTLAETVELSKRREQAAEWDKGEAAIAAQLLMNSRLPSPPDIDEETRQALQPFVAWTTQNAPAKPHTVAAFIYDQAATGASTARLLQQVEAIARLHDRHNLANPCATVAARYALEMEISIEPPRSWTRAEKEAFVELPPEVRGAIARREREREVELRRCQNELAALKKRLEAELESVETKEKENANG
jgi:hypothetical protein